MCMYPTESTLWASENQKGQCKGFSTYLKFPKRNERLGEGKFNLISPIISSTVLKVGGIYHSRCSMS